MNTNANAVAENCELDGPERRTGLRSFLKSVAVLSGGIAGAQALNFALMPLVTRLYLPVDMANLSLFTSFQTIAAIVISLRYDLGIVSADSEREASILVLMSALLAFPISVVSAVVLGVLSKYALLGFGTLPLYAAVLMPLSLGAIGVFGALRYWFVRHERYMPISHATTLQNGVRVAAQAALGFWGSTTAGLLAGETAGRFIGMSKMFRTALPILRADLAKLSLHEIRSCLARHKKLPLFTLPSTMIDAIGANMTIPLIILLYGSDVGGQFGLVNRVMSVPIVLIATSVADVFHSRMAISARDRTESCQRLFWATSAGLLLVSILPAAILFFFGEPLFVVVFGKRWALAGTFAALSVPRFLSMFVVSPLTRLVVVLHGQDVKFCCDLVVLSSLGAVFWLAKSHHWAATHTVLWLSLVSTIGYAVYFCVMIALMGRTTTGASLETV